MKQHIIYISTSYINQGIISSNFSSKASKSNKQTSTSWPCTL